MTTTPPSSSPVATALVFDGQNSLVVLDQPLPAFPAGVTVEFWAKGGDDLPRDTSVFASWKADGARILNIHLPWADGVVYWDAGGDGYDRIPKAAEPGEYKGSWAHWAFVKDVAKQEMSIYRNGALWLRAGGKARPLAEGRNANIGAFVDGTRKWSGRLAEFRIWDRARTEEEVRADRGRRLTGQEPGLVGYWPLDRIDANGTTPDLTGHRPGAVQGATTAPDDALAAALAAAAPPAAVKPPAAAPPPQPAAATGASGAGRAAVDLTGEWIVYEASFSYALHLKQQGTTVSGTYDFQGGTLEGTVEGRTAKLRWDQPGNRRGGPSEMTIAPDGQSMTGTWAYDPTVYNSGLTGSGTWTFRRKSPPATGEATTTAGPAVPSEVAPEGAAPSVQFLSGSFSTWRGQDAGWSLDQGIGEREFVKHVAFSKRFDAPPQVVVELSGLDVDPRKVTRVEVSARNVTPEGFDLVFRTWSDSIVNSVGANWLALESGRVALSGESFGTARTEVAAWELVQGIGEREYVKHVTFSKRFDTPPQVVVGTSLLDVDQSKNTRVEVSARNVTPEGFDLVFRTWFDSIVYNLGANWLALEQAHGETPAPPHEQFLSGSYTSWQGKDPKWKLTEGMGEREFVERIAFPQRFEPPP
ncbi:MAG: hypothetical protein JO034_31510, partial [Singulisphaera sp.]|nr:hypothetical protein [Singulisphaera sp.]